MELIFQQALNSAAAELGRAIASDPSGFANAAEQALGELFGHNHHTGYDTIQDIWDAVEGGHISHSAALQATAILAADLERRSQRSAQASVPHPEREVKEQGGTDYVEQIFAIVNSCQPWYSPKL